MAKGGVIRPSQVLGAQRDLRHQRQEKSLQARDPYFERGLGSTPPFRAMGWGALRAVPDLRGFALGARDRPVAPVLRVGADACPHSASYPRRVVCPAVAGRRAWLCRCWPR